jgi:hypothetical protein
MNKGFSMQHEAHACGVDEPDANGMPQTRQNGGLIAFNPSIASQPRQRCSLRASFPHKAHTGGKMTSTIASMTAGTFMRRGLPRPQGA